MQEKYNNNVHRVWKWVTVTMTLRNVYWRDETADLGFDLGFDWRVRNKQNSISYSNVSHVRMYGKLRLNAWHKAINNIKILSKIGRAELFSPSLPKTCNAGTYFLIGCSDKHGEFSLPHSQWLRSGTIGPALLLAGQSEPCIQGSGQP